MSEQRRYVLASVGLALVIFGLAKMYDPPPARAAVHRPVFAAQTETGDTAVVDVSQLVIGEWVTATAQIETVGGPSACTYQVLGRLTGTTTFFVLGETSDCTSGAMFHLANKPVDEIKGHLEMTGGTSARLFMKLVTR